MNNFHYYPHCFFNCSLFIIIYFVIFFIVHYSFFIELIMRFKILFFLINLCCIAVGFSQPINGARPEYLLQAAEERKEAKDYYNSLDLYEKYYEQTKDLAAAFEIAQMNKNLNDYAKAETWYSRFLQRTKNITTVEVDPNTRFYYAQMMKMNGKYDESIIAFEDFLKESKDSVKNVLAQNEILGAKQAMGMKENVQLVVDNIGTGVNTPNNEYSPSITGDGNTLYFTAFRSKGIIKLDGKEDDPYVKVYKSMRDTAGEWSKAIALDDKINRVGAHQGGVALSTDGKMMYFTRIGLSGNEVTQSNLYVSKKQDDGTFGNVNEVKSLNGKYIIKHPNVGEMYGKEVLFFASNMDGTKGGFDIYYATKNEDGSFGIPVNAGNVINTLGDEETPYYRDGKLYFSSNGLPGMGGFDIFVANWDGSTWSTPKNLGTGYNSSTNDRYPSIDDDGSIFLVSNRIGGRSLKSKTCCEDIYIAKKAPIRIDLIVNATDGTNPLKGLTFQMTDISGGKNSGADTKTADTYNSTLNRGRAYNIITSKPGYYNDTIQFNTVGINTSSTIKKEVRLRPTPTIVASLRAITMADGQQLKGVLYSLTEVESGNNDTRTLDMYIAKLGLRKNYMIIATKAGYTSDTARFSTVDIKTTTTIEKTLNLRAKLITVNRLERIKLQDIYYKLDKYEATEEHMDNWALVQQSLDYLHGILKKYPDIVIELSSHTDSRGSDSYNLDLSQRRAEGIKKYLVEKGIETRRMIAKGYGETKLVNRCKNGVKCSEEEHLKNRRTEFRIISGPETIEISEQKPVGN